MPICKICGGGEVTFHEFREMMFGTRELFTYFECKGCGTIQLPTIPDLAVHYPKNYYSFNASSVGFSRKLTTSFVARSAAKHFIGRKTVFGRFWARKKAWTSELFPWFLRERSLNLSMNSRILDVGCGNGELLDTLANFGFTRLIGADPFIDKDMALRAGVRVHKRSVDKLDGRFDLIMFNHSFEHLVRPKQTLAAVRDRLSRDGTCIIRIPVVSEAWRAYGKDWVQLDAPRHLFLFSETGFLTLADSAGFSVQKVVYDSNEFQFWGSELYRRDIPLVDPADGSPASPLEIFGSCKMANWRERALSLNAKGLGDQAAFFLTH